MVNLISKTRGFDYPSDKNSPGKASSESSLYENVPNAQIRVLHLKPSPLFSSPIQCELKLVSVEDIRGLNKRYAYEALSYTWGDTEGTVPITCDGRELLVTPNCESALRHLRYKLTKRVLWVDAICIDQKSVEDRNVQVPMMGQIYSLAKKVIIWLGPGVQEEEDMLRHARIGGRIYFARGMPKEKIMPHEKLRHWVSKIMNEEEVQIVQRVCSNVWFTRIWTIQELVLATTAVFQIGHTECPATALYSYQIIAQALSKEELDTSIRFSMRSRLMEILQPGNAESKAFMSDTETLGRSPEKDEAELLSLAWRLACLSDSSEPRDKIYGMFGLLQHLTGTKKVVLPEVDYKKAIEQIFEETTRNLIWQHQSLWPLEIIARSRSSRGQGNDSYDLPSWVPDLRDPSTICIDWRPGIYRDIARDKVLHPRKPTKLEKQLEERLRQKNPELYDKKSKLGHPEHRTEGLITDAPGRLPVQASFLAEVEEVFARMPAVGMGAPDEDFIRTETLSQWTAIATSLEDSEPAGQTPPGGFIRALCILTPSLNYLRDHHSGSESEKKESQRFTAGNRQPRDAHDGAVLFRTRCGLLGLCKGRVRRGDMVWQLAGGRYPFVLHRTRVRPKQSVFSSWSVDTREKLYRLVGIADLHGLDDENRKMRWCKDYQQQRFHDITLI